MDKLIGIFSSHCVQFFTIYKHLEIWSERDSLWDILIYVSLTSLNSFNYRLLRKITGNNNISSSY